MARTVAADACRRRFGVARPAPGAGHPAGVCRLGHGADATGPGHHAAVIHGAAARCHHGRGAAVESSRSAPTLPDRDRRGPGGGAVAVTVVVAFFWSRVHLSADELILSEA